MRRPLDQQLSSFTLKERAYAEGFQKVGIVPASTLDRERLRLHEWLKRSYHGEMKWMERDPDKRSNPAALLPGARSVMVVALNYYTPFQHHQEKQTGKVSRYAWGDDYHDVINGKLNSILRWAKQQHPELEGKVCVDIQPMMDKAWAVRAGLGWLGKHSNVITTDYGSWVFIGELILNVELEYDVDQVDDHCGTCTLCIDACPTQAITEPYVVDSNKCISYATIELRGPELPAVVAENLSGWFYGCDICQDVCPWNRFEQVSAEERFLPREGNVNQSLAEISNLTHEEYVERFRGSAMKRAKLSGLQRNAKALLNSPQRRREE
jgi:epoxyqueuosine reductase